MNTKKSSCATCKHEMLPSGCEPCCYCIDYKRWEPEDYAKTGFDPGAPEDYAKTGFDPGAPEGDKTNVRLDWGERGPEIIGERGPEIINIMREKQLKDGPLVETVRAVMKQITRLDYAIEGVRSKIGSIGIKFTDKNMSRDEIAFLGGQLNALRVDLFELEEEREKKLRGAADVEFKDPDS